MDSRKRREGMQVFFLILLGCSISSYGKAVPEDVDKYVRGYEYTFKNNKHEVRPLYETKKALEPFGIKKNIYKDSSPIQYEYDGKAIFIPPVKRFSESNEMLNDYYNLKQKLNPHHQGLPLEFTTNFPDFPQVWTSESSDIYNHERNYDYYEHPVVTSSVINDVHDKTEDEAPCTNCHVSIAMGNYPKTPKHKFSEDYVKVVNKKKHGTASPQYPVGNVYYQPTKHDVKKVKTSGKRNKKTKVKHSSTMSYDDDAVFNPVIKNKVKTEQKGTIETDYSKFHTEKNKNSLFKPSKTPVYNAAELASEKNEFSKKPQKEKCSNIKDAGTHITNCLENGNFPESEKSPELYEHPPVVGKKKQSTKSFVNYGKDDPETSYDINSPEKKDSIEIVENLQNPSANKLPEKKFQKEKKRCTKLDPKTGEELEHCLDENLQETAEVIEYPTVLKTKKHETKSSIEYEENDHEKDKFSSNTESTLEGVEKERFENDLKEPLTKVTEKIQKQKCTKINPKTGTKDCTDEYTLKSTKAPQINEPPVIVKKTSTKSSVKYDEANYHENGKSPSDNHGTSDEHKKVVESYENVDDALKSKFSSDDVEEGLDLENQNTEPNIGRNSQNSEFETENKESALPIDNTHSIPDILEVDDRLRSLSLLNSNLFSLVFNPNAKDHNLKKCVTRSNESGYCMYVQNCPVPNIASSLEQLLNNACAVDDVFIGVCCPEFPVETIQVQWEQFDKDSNDKDDEDVDPEKQDCGTRSDEAAKMESWPWKVTFLNAPLVSMSNGKIFCGGVIVGDEYVLTAAHCTTKIPKNQILVRLGQHDDSSGEDFVVVEIKRHAQYNPRTMQNDVALLKLGRRVPYGKHINKVCLPEDDGEMHAGEKALLLGWKGVFGESPKKSEFLKVMSNEECKNRLSTSVTQFLLCTETRNEDERTCNADSGAPLVIEDDDKYEVIGILSWNRNDCDQRFPSTFSRVANYLGWIKKHAV